jgi:hypothetical protein
VTCQHREPRPAVVAHHADPVTLRQGEQRLDTALVLEEHWGDLVHGLDLLEALLDHGLTYKIRPSFYMPHTYYFAEAHIANRGKEQAMYISPMRDAIEPMPIKDVKVVETLNNQRLKPVG